MRPSAAAMWHTPNVPKEVEANGQTDKGKRQVGLENQAKFWTTPQAHDSTGGNPDRVRRHGTKHGCANLADDVTMWPTPNARDDHNPSTPDSARSQRKLEQGWTVDPNEAAVWWPIPTSRDHKDGDVTNSEVPTNALLGRTASRFSLPALETPTHGVESSRPAQTSRRRLNPAFVEWLMGLPVGWTDFAALETAWFFFRARQRLQSFFRGQNDLD